MVRFFISFKNLTIFLFMPDKNTCQTLNQY